MNSLTHEQRPKIAMPNTPPSFVAIDAQYASSVLETKELDPDVLFVKRVGPETIDLFHKIAHAISKSFSQGSIPKLTDWQSTGGAYFIHDVNDVPTAVIKPEDEEPYALNNPKRSGEEADQLLVKTQADLFIGYAYLFIPSMQIHL